MVNTENLITVKDKAEKAYELINDLISNHSLDMFDLAYPNHDGVQNAEVAAEMMSLRHSVNSLSVACNYLVNKLTDVIGDELEVELNKIGYCYRDNGDGSYDVCYDHEQDAYFTGVCMYHVATVKDDAAMWYINNNEGAGWGEYPKKDWTLKDAIYDQCIDDHTN